MRSEEITIQINPIKEFVEKIQRKKSLVTSSTDDTSSDKGGVEDFKICDEINSYSRKHKSDYLFASVMDKHEIEFKESFKPDEYLDNFFEPQNVGEIEMNKDALVRILNSFGWYGSEKPEDIQSFPTLIPHLSKKSEFNTEKAKKFWTDLKFKQESYTKTDESSLDLISKITLSSICKFHNFGIANKIKITFFTLTTKASTFDTKAFSVGDYESDNRFFFALSKNDDKETQFDLIIAKRNRFVAKKKEKSISKQCRYTFIYNSYSNNEQDEFKFGEKLCTVYNNNFFIDVFKSNEKLTIESNTRSINKTFIYYYSGDFNGLKKDEGKKMPLSLYTSCDYWRKEFQMEYLNNFFDEPTFNGGMFFLKPKVRRECQFYKFHFLIRNTNSKEPSNVIPHFSISTWMPDLRYVYIDHQMRLFLVFFFEGKVMLYEGNVGSQSTGDMKSTSFEVHSLESVCMSQCVYENNEIQFARDTIFFYFKDKDDQPRNSKYTYICKNGVYMWSDEKSNDSDKNMWSAVKYPQGIRYVQILDSGTKATYEIGKDPSVSNLIDIKFLENNISTVIGFEYNNKLFLRLSDSQLYHPPKRNAALSTVIISLYYRLFRHVDQSNINEIFSGESICCILFPLIDIGFRGKITEHFNCPDIPGIYEKDFGQDFEKYQAFYPQIKTWGIIFNNCGLKVGISRHRTKCQLAATALFGYACRIYGPGIRIREFRLEKESSLWKKEEFLNEKKCLIATYGTLLAMNNEEDFRFALETIAREAKVDENIEAYDNLLQELQNSS